MLPETPRQRREREALEEDLLSAPLRGKPLSLRLTNFRPMADAYLAAGRGPLAYMLRLHEIEKQTADHAERLEEAWHALALEREGAAREFEREWRETASGWSFHAVNDLIERHNRWYPVESRLGMDPSTGEFALVNGRDYRLPGLGVDWVLERFPPVLDRALATSWPASSPRAGRMVTVTLSELAVTVALLCGLGLVARRFGLSAIPAYLLAGLLLGPNEPEEFALIKPSEVTDFVAELGLVFLLFFLGLEFTLTRLRGTGRHLGIGGTVDLVANLGLGLIVGFAAFGFSSAALILAACVYVSSSAIAVKGLIDFRRLGDDETDLVLAILVFEDIAVALLLGFAAAGGGEVPDTLVLVAKALGFVTAGLAASRWLSRPVDRLLDRLPLEFFLLAVFGFLVGSAAVAEELGLSAAIGALMAGVVLSETSVRDQIEERFFSFRDIFAALFFFAFGLSIDLGALGDVGWLVALAVALTLIGKFGAGLVAGAVGGFNRRQSVNAGAALVAHGEFTIILAQLASENPSISPAQRTDLVAFAGLYVLATATIGLALMKESKRVGRKVFPAPRLIEEEA